MKTKNRLILHLNVVYILFIIILLNMPSEVEQLKKDNYYLRENIVSGLEIQQVEINKLKYDYNILKKKKVLTPQDMIVLEKITQLEASNQKLKGKAMVSSVILNRAIKHDKSVMQVVNERGQFEPVSRGLMRKPLDIPLETKQAVIMATYKDYTNGAEYFQNPKISKNKQWFDNNLVRTVVYADHIFYKE